MAHFLWMFIPLNKSKPLPETGHPADFHYVIFFTHLKGSVVLGYPLVNQHSYGKSLFLMGKSTISMAIFNSKLLVYQRVVHIHRSEASFQ